MLRATIQSSIPDSSGKLKALVKSGKMIPESFNFTSPCPSKRKILAPSLLKDPGMYDTDSMEALDDEDSDRSGYSGYEGDTEGSMETSDDEVLNRNVACCGGVHYNEEPDEQEASKRYYDAVALENARYDAQMAGVKEVPNSLVKYVPETKESDEKKPYQIGVLRLSEIRALAEKSATVQYTMLKQCSPQLIKDLHKLLKYAAFTRHLKIPREYKIFLSRHRDFLLKFLDEKNCDKKKKALLKKGVSGFLGLLIQVVTSTACDVLPGLLVTRPGLAVVEEYPSNNVYDTSDDDSDSDAEESFEDSSSSEETENEESEEEEAEEEECDVEEMVSEGDEVEEEEESEVEEPEVEEEELEEEEDEDEGGEYNSLRGRTYIH